MATMGAPREGAEGKGPPKRNTRGRSQTPGQRQNSSLSSELDRLPLSHELLAYYRQRIERSEEDYLQALKMIDAIKPSQEAYHQSQWQVGQCQVHIAELQKALSDAQTALGNERKMIVQLIAENDALKSDPPRLALYDGKSSISI